MTSHSALSSCATRSSPARGRFRAVARLSGMDYALTDCVLRLRSPSSAADGHEDREDFRFMGDEERILGGCLAHLDEFATPPPIEEWDEDAERTVIVSEDPWTAAVLL